jgi:peptide-methionine (S)-S-oxide reductase
MRELQQFYPEHQDLVASTAAARMNGYADGNGTVDQLSNELPSLGLSADGEKVLKGMVR